MKTYLSILTVFALSLALMAQSPPPPVAASRSPEQLNELLGPIALYPDALVALILPAATKPNDVLIAAQYLRGNGDPAQIDNLPWDESVKNLAHYAQVVLWMDENIKWTEAVGEAFSDQPADVMNAMQVLRAKARAAGNLVDTPQQNVVVDDGSIVIEPAQPNVIYVPQYDPALVYLARPYWYDAPLISFGFGFGIGPWLHYDCDWRGRGIWIGDRHRDWRHDGRGWDYRRWDGHREGRPWRPDPTRSTSRQWDSSRAQAGVPHPRSSPGAPRNRSSDFDRSGGDNRWDRSRDSVNNDW